MEKVKGFLKKKDIVFSVKRYGIDALGAMAQGLFCTLLIGTILNTLGNQFGVGFLKAVVATVNGTDYTVGGLASAMAGPAMAVAIGYALKAPQLVLFSLITVGFAANALGGAGGPLAVYFIAVIATELGKVVSKETKIDILVTPLVTIGSGVAVSALLAPTLGAIAMKVGDLIMLATNLQPFWMGIAVSVLVGVALTLPISDLQDWPAVLLWRDVVRRWLDLQLCHSERINGVALFHRESEHQCSRWVTSSRIRESGSHL
mgnify:CR=1 FL=1